MNITFNDSSLIIQYIQQRIKEMYNSDILVTSEYYTTFDMNYGMAHFIAKYLDYAYPLLDKESIQEYNSITSTPTAPRSLTKPISVFNYFLCDNKGNRLVYNPGYIYAQGSNGIYTNIGKIESPIYDEIYNEYMSVTLKQNISADGTQLSSPYWSWNTKYFKFNDPPIFTEQSDDEYTVNNNIIFNLATWNTSKGICEIDNFVASYILGRVIGPNSSMEEIYYAQQLLIQDREITQEEKGVWCPYGAEGTYMDMTQTVINYQKQKVTPNANKTLFVTGYFDVATEAQILKDLGDRSYGILGI